MEYNPVDYWNGGIWWNKIIQWTTGMVIQWTVQGMDSWVKIRDTETTSLQRGPKWSPFDLLYAVCVMFLLLLLLLLLLIPHPVSPFPHSVLMEVTNL